MGKVLLQFALWRSSRIKNRYMHIAYRKKYQTGGDWYVGDSRGVPYNDTVNVSVKENTNAGIKIGEGKPF